MKLSPKRVNWYICRISDITYSLPSKKIIFNILEMCVGEVLLKQWKQGNTSFSETIKGPVKGVFFLTKFTTSIYFSLSVKDSL